MLNLKEKYSLEISANLFHIKRDISKKKNGKAQVFAQDRHLFLVQGLTLNLSHNYLCLPIMMI